MKKIFTSLALSLAGILAFASVAFAINITVPAAPGAGYFLISTSTGQYFASSSPMFSSGLRFINATGTNATTTTLFSTSLSGTNLFVTNATSTTFALVGTLSKLLITDANGTIGGYAGTSCTNQFVRSLSALGSATCATVGAGDVSLANLTATDSTLTFSGTYTGATARTIGLNLANANTWSGGQTFGNTTTTNATSTTLFSTTAIFTNSTSTNAASTNNTITNATTTNLFSTTASSTNLFTNSLGVASSTPSFKVSVNGAINVAEFTPATSTSMTVSWANGNQQLVKIGTSATTIGFSNAIAGAHLTLILCNPPSGTGGAVTFTGVLWPGGTAPTTTTTAKKCDIITLLSTFATTTGPQILGGFNQNY